MGRPKQLKDAVRVSVVLPRAQMERVQQLALRMSLEEGRAITASEAIRLAIEKCYPMPNKQMSFL